MEVGLFSEKALRRAGLTDVLIRSGFEVRPFHQAALLPVERLVRAAAAFIVDLDMDQHAPGRVLATLRASMPQLPRFVIGSPLQVAALAPGDAVHLGSGEEQAHQLAQRLRHALQGQPAVPVPDPQVNPIAQLTPRQREVMCWIAAGTDNLKIAAELGIGERAVKLHVTTLLKRFALDNRTELALLAWRAGFRPPVP
jgi:DNA-binding NarL/FixJ family response regulator